MPLRGYENNLVRQASQRTKMGISDLPRKSISGINMIYTAAPTAQSQLVVRATETGSRMERQLAARSASLQQESRLSGMLSPGKQQS